MDLNELRQDIDILDQQIFDAFTKRMDLCRQVAAYKIENNLPVFQTAREDAVVEKARGRVPEELSDGAALLSRTVMDISKHLQYRQILASRGKNTPTRPHCGFNTLRNVENVRVGCAGTEGANGETACKKLFGDGCDPAFYKTFDEVKDRKFDGMIIRTPLPVQWYRPMI